jgi:ferric-dicitrate binding protein FerR (iron transport regulator)
MIKLLAPGETRSETLADGSTVTMEWTCNGSYVQVTHRDADRTIRFNRNFAHDFDAVRRYDELTA